MFNNKVIANTIADNANMRVLRSTLSQSKHRITKMEEQRRNTISDNSNIAEDIKISTRLSKLLIK